MTQRSLWHENHGGGAAVLWAPRRPQRLVEKNLGDVVLHDIIDGMPQGKALDMMQSACLEGFDSEVKGTNDPADYAGSDIVVITSGLARQPGMSRDDLLIKNGRDRRRRGRQREAPRARRHRHRGEQSRSTS